MSRHTMFRHTIRSITFAGLLLAMAVSTAQAGLTWQRRDVRVEAAVTQRKVRTAYPFKNTGERAVTITKVTASCGCTTAALKQKTYKPGESGTITAIFTPGPRSGQQTKRIVVRTGRGRAGALCGPAGFGVAGFVRAWG